MPQRQKSNELPAIPAESLACFGPSVRHGTFAKVLTLAAILLTAVAVAHAGEKCLTCHVPGSGLTNSKGKDITVNGDTLKKSVHGTLGCVDCHTGAAKEGHTAKAAAASCLSCHPDAWTNLSRSAHAVLGRPESSEACISCHGAHDVATPQQRGTQLCATCHESEVTQFAASVHGREGRRGNGDAPKCSDCHDAAHKTLAASDVNSSVSKARLPETCGRCHSNPEFTRKYLLAIAKPVEAYEASVHGKAIRQGNLKAAVCNDCHGVHDILPASDPRSPIAKARVASTCAKCHEPVFAVYRESIHGRAVAAGVDEAPTCTDCHGEHRILGPADPGSPVSATNVASVTCSHCHGDTRLMARLDLPAGRVASYENSFHGLAAKSGSKTVANCASCHGVHNILPSSDPRSTVAKANLPKTCGQCHPDAGTRLAIGPIHVVAAAGSERLLYYVRLFYLFTIPTVLGFMFLHNLLDWWRKARRKLAEYRSSHLVLRLTFSERIQHVLLLASFIILVVTGFALKFPGSFWAAPIVQWEGNYPIRGWIHRLAGVMLIAASLYHAIYLLFWKSGRRWVIDMLPRGRDLRDAVAYVGYNLGYRRKMPTFSKFNYAEKAEYWALVWGTIVMALSGIVLWAHNFVLKYLSTAWIDISTAIHYYEAILATAAIVIWHFYAVIFDPDVYPLKWTFLTGRAPEHEVREEEPEPVPEATPAAENDSDRAAKRK
jgi:formate dehydrogenase gamma subunit